MQDDTIHLSEEDYNRLIREANEYRFALAAFMAAYGNCDIPGALMNLAHKPESIPGLTERDSCETAMMRAWMRGAKALGVTLPTPAPWRIRP